MCNQKVHGDPFRPGDLVVVMQSSSWTSQALETTLISSPRKLLDVNHRIQHPGNNKFTVVHFDWLKLCPITRKGTLPCTWNNVSGSNPSRTYLEQDVLYPQDGDTADPLAPANTFADDGWHMQDGLQINIRLNVNPRRIRWGRGHM